MERRKKEQWRDRENMECDNSVLDSGIMSPILKTLSKLTLFAFDEFMTTYEIKRARGAQKWPFSKAIFVIIFLFNYHY